MEKYRGKKIFLTGHTGFKGAWLVYWLKFLGAEIRAYALPTEKPSLYAAINGDDFCESIEADIRDFEKLKKSIVDFQPDFIFHLAAQSLVRDSYPESLYTFEVNAMGTANVLESLKYLDKKCSVVIITTDKVYDNKEWIYPYREMDRLGGYDPYSASKACAELITNSYTKSFFNLDYFDEHQKAIATARAGNVIGGGDWTKDALIPDIARALDKGEEIIIRSPKAVRPWQHVLEALSGYLQLGLALDDNPQQMNGAWNFGPQISDNLTVQELVEKALEVWGTGSYSVVESDKKMHEAILLKLDISKAISQLDWQPKYNADEAIQCTMAWYKDFMANPKQARNLVERDILFYTQEEKTIYQL